MFFLLLWLLSSVVVVIGTALHLPSRSTQLNMALHARGNDNDSNENHSNVNGNALTVSLFTNALAMHEQRKARTFTGKQAECEVRGVLKKFLADSQWQDSHSDPNCSRSLVDLIVCSPSGTAKMTRQRLLGSKTDKNHKKHQKL